MTQDDRDYIWADTISWNNDATNKALCYWKRAGTHALCVFTGQGAGPTIAAGDGWEGTGSGEGCTQITYVAYIGKWHLGTTILPLMDCLLMG